MLPVQVHTTSTGRAQAHLLKVAEGSYPAVIPNNRVLDDGGPIYAHIPNTAVLPQ